MIGVWRVAFVSVVFCLYTLQVMVFMLVFLLVCAPCEDGFFLLAVAASLLLALSCDVYHGQPKLS